jgi:cytochrome P450
MLKALQCVNKYGDFYYLSKQAMKKDPNLEAKVGNFGTKVVLVYCAPSTFKEFYSNTQHYQKSKMFLGFIEKIVGSGLVTSEGEQWKRHRKVIGSTFHYEFLKQMLPTVKKTVQEHFDALDLKAGDTIEVLTEMKKVTGEVVGKIFFAQNMKEITFEGEKITIALDKILKELISVLFSPLGMIGGIKLVKMGLLAKHRKLIQRLEDFRKLCKDIVDKRRIEIIAQGTQLTQNDASKRKDMLQLLLENQISGAEDKFSDDEIIDEFMTFFVAGMDTTAHLITMTTYLLSQNPEAKAKVLEEINQCYLTAANDEMSIDILNQMEYLQMVLRESLRMIPSARLVPLEAVDDHMIGKIKVKKGTLVDLDFIANNFNPKYYEDPDKFNPERFTAKEMQNRETYAYLPFSSGPRNCIGQHLALNEARIILSEFLSRFDYELMPGYKMKLTVKGSYQPADPVIYKLKAK